MLQTFRSLAMNVKGNPQTVLNLGILRLHRRGLLPGRQRMVFLSSLFQLRGLIDQLVKFYGRYLDVRDSISRNIHELRQVHGAIGCSSVIDEDGWTRVAVA